MTTIEKAVTSLRRNGPLRVGIGGPVGSGKTTLCEKICLAARDHWSIGVVTNDIYTVEDAEALVRRQALPVTGSSAMPSPGQNARTAKSASPSCTGA